MAQDFGNCREGPDAMEGLLFCTRSFISRRICGSRRREIPMGRPVKHDSSCEIPEPGPVVVRPSLDVLAGSVQSFLKGEDDMGRRRLQQKGDLYQQGGWWKLRWKEDRKENPGER